MKLATQVYLGPIFFGDPEGQNVFCLVKALRCSLHKEPLEQSY